MHAPLRPLRPLQIALLALGASCAAPRATSERGWAPPVLPAQATLRSTAPEGGGAVALLVETQNGVLLRVGATRLAPGRHELVLAPDAERAWPLERLGVLLIGAEGRGELELELAHHTLAAQSRLIGRGLALVGPDRSLLRGLIEKGLEVQTLPADGPPPTRSDPTRSDPPRPSPRAAPSTVPESDDTP